METMNPTANGATTARTGSIGTVVLRVALGLTMLFTWLDNVGGDFYSAEEFAGFFDWVQKPVAEEGNGASLGFFHSIIDSTILQAPGFFGFIIMIVELAIAVGLTLGLFTRAASLAAIGFFSSLFLTYFGGEEWIWTYVMLTAAAVAIFLDWGGRLFGADQAIAKSKGESPFTLIW